MRSTKASARQAKAPRAAARRIAKLRGRKPAPRPDSFAGRFLDAGGKFALDEISASFGLSKGQLAETVGLRPETLHRTERVLAPKTQTRVREMLEIVGRVSHWAGGEAQALAWYRGEPIPAFGDRTAEALVKDGNAAAVRDYLDNVALGGFA